MVELWRKEWLDWIDLDEERIRRSLDRRRGNEPYFVVKWILYERPPHSWKGKGETDESRQFSPVEIGLVSAEESTPSSLDANPTNFLVCLVVPSELNYGVRWKFLSNYVEVLANIKKRDTRVPAHVHDLGLPVWTSDCMLEPIQAPSPMIRTEQWNQDGAIGASLSAQK